MLLLALISGLINLSSQVVFQKVVSMVAGDLYTTFMAVLLTFIFGSAIGSYFGHYLRRYLAFIEMGSGVFSLLVFFLLRGPFYEHSIPTFLVIGALFIPALALGTHIPLYSYYLKRLKFGWTYGLYHAGAVFGLLGFEWYFVNAGSLKNAVLFLAICQLSLGVAVAILMRIGKFQLDPLKRNMPLGTFVRENKTAVVGVFLASVISFYFVLWALKTQTVLNETYRMHATLISVAIFVWMATAGVIGSRLKVFSAWGLFAAMGAAILFIHGSFPWVPQFILDLNDGSLVVYFAVSLRLALYFTMPVFFSSLIFVNFAQDLAKRYDVDVASGTLNLFASFGNIVGFVFAGAMAAFFWTNEYFLFGSLLCFVIAAPLALTGKKGRGFVVFAICAIVAMIFVFQKQQKDFLFKARLHKEFRSWSHIENVRIFAHALSVMGLYTDLPATKEAVDSGQIKRRFYMVDGHVSHDIWSSIEFISGLSSSQYFQRPLKRSVVIGVGSGQAAWGVAAISEHTDLVEISPVVVEHLDILKNLNGDLRHRADVTLHLADGFAFLRECQPGSYDLIFNTATYPSSYNASKLYSDEFVELAKNCLSPNGVYQTYFDENSVTDMTSWWLFLAPLQKHFRHVDVMFDPYPQVYAYDEPRELHHLGQKDFVREVDFKYFDDLHHEEIEKKCRPFIRDIPKPSVDVPLNSLDRAYLEQNAIRKAITWRYSTPNYQEFVEFYRNPDGTKAPAECY